MASPLGIAWGAEWRQETFESVAGDEASYVVGPFAAQGFSSGSNGYQGLHPSNAGKWDRPNYALYVDLQADVVPQLQLGTAVRYEDYYADFGNTLNGKLSALLRASERPGQLALDGQHWVPRPVARSGKSSCRDHGFFRHRWLDRAGAGAAHPSHCCSSGRRGTDRGKVRGIFRWYYHGTRRRF